MIAQYTRDKLKRLHIKDSEVVSCHLGEIHYLHGGKEINSTAFYKGTEQGIALSVPRSLGAVSAVITIFAESGKIIDCPDMKFSDLDGAFDIFEARLSLRGGLYFFTVSLDTATGKLYVKKSGAHITFSENSGDKFQLSVTKKPRRKRSPLLGGIIYHIFVDRFSKDGAVKPKDGTVIAKDWSVIPEFPEYPGAPLKNNTFYGGSLYSAAKKLDMLAELGTSIVYLSPVFDSPSNHKYDTSDYMRVDEMFGGDDGLRYFITEAKKHGIGVILDGVFNHTGADSVYFNRYGKYDTLGAYQSVDSEYYDWYSFKSFPDDYVCWWGIEILPRINTGNPKFEKFILENVIPKYREMGILGLRLDVADELSDDFIKKIKHALDRGGENILYGEVWEDASNKIAYGKRKNYYSGSELDGVMNYPLREGIIDYLRSKRTDKLLYALTEVLPNMPKHIRDMTMNLLGTHDTPRIITALGGEDAKGKSNAELSELRMSKDERTKAEKLVKAAYTILATLPGLPTIFYADEVGLEGYSDPFNRMPYPECGIESLLQHYKRIGAVRRSEAVYRDGEFKLNALNKDILAFSRYRDTSSTAYLTVYNNSDDAFSIEFEDRTPELTEGIRAITHTVLQGEAKIFKTTKHDISNFF